MPRNEIHKHIDDTFENVAKCMIINKTPVNNSKKRRNNKIS
jgi:hypothetical protein